MSKSIQFPVLTRFQYCQKLDIEAGPNNKFKTLIWKKTISKSMKFPFITRLNIAKNWISKRALV